MILQIPRSILLGCQMSMLSGSDRDKVILSSVHESANVYRGKGGQQAGDNKCLELKKSTLKSGNSNKSLHMCSRRFLKDESSRESNFVLTSCPRCGDDVMYLQPSDQSGSQTFTQQQDQYLLQK